MTRFPRPWYAASYHPSPSPLFIQHPLRGSKPCPRLTAPDLLQCHLLPSYQQHHLRAFASPELGELYGPCALRILEKRTTEDPLLQTGPSRVFVRFEHNRPVFSPPFLYPFPSLSPPLSLPLSNGILNSHIPSSSLRSAANSSVPAFERRVSFCSATQPGADMEPRGHQEVCHSLTRGYSISSTRLLSITEAGRHMLGSI